MSDERENLDRSCGDPANISLQYEQLEESLDIPTFEFSSPISSISSNCSSPDRERTIQPPDMDADIDDEYVSLEELKSQISPPSDDECSGFSATKTAIDVLETIFEDCYLETPPGTPTTPRAKKRPRRVRTSLIINFEEFKENVQNNHKHPES